MKNTEKFTHYTFAIDDKDLIEHQLKSPIGNNNRAIHIMPQVAGGVEWLIYIVVAIVIGLVMQNIFKPPKPKDAIETNSYLFAGTQNVAAQGVPVPLGYGRLRVGSVVLSAAVRHLEYAPTSEKLEPIIEPFMAYAWGYTFQFRSETLGKDIWYDLSETIYGEEGGVWGYLEIDPYTHNYKVIIQYMAEPNWGDDDYGYGEWPEGWEEGRCWVAREVYGVNNPKWLLFRHWLLNYSPNWFCNWYEQNGKRAAKWLSKNSWLKPVIRRWMNGRIQSLGKNIK